MDLYFDLSRGYFVSSNGTSDRVTALSLKRGDTVQVVVRFCRGITLVELGTGASGILGAKEQGDYDGDYVAAALSWTKAGTGTATTYTFELNLGTEELDDLLGVGVATDVESVTLNLELQFTVGDIVTSSNTLALTVYNDVVRGDESGPTDITGGTPVNETAATLTVNPTGADNSVLYTAAAGLGADGNAVTVAYATPAAQFTTTVAVATSAITVTPGTKARMIVTGSLTSDGSTPVVFPELYYDSVAGEWSDNPGGSPDYQVSGSSGAWALESVIDVALWTSSDAVASPDLVTTWTPVSAATGTPVITAGTSAAAQVITAVNASVAASALVTASASGTVTGAVAAVAAANLTGGIDATSGFLGSMQVAPGFLYVVSSVTSGVPTWEKVALSSL